MKSKSISEIHNFDNDLDIFSSHNVKMIKASDLNHLRAWREFRQMTQDELALQVGTTGSVISMLESGDRGLSPKWLAKLAPALQARPGHILDFDPNDIDDDILDLWANIDDKDKDRARRILQTFAINAVES